MACPQTGHKSRLLWTWGRRRGNRTPTRLCKRAATALGRIDECDSWLARRLPAWRSSPEEVSVLGTARAAESARSPQLEQLLLNIEAPVDRAANRPSFRNRARALGQHLVDGAKRRDEAGWYIPQIVQVQVLELGDQVIEMGK